MFHIGLAHAIELPMTGRPAPPQRHPIKGLAIRLQDADRDAELEAAKSSLYYWWWAFLRESREYRQAISGSTEEPYASMARDFGNLGHSFEYWWFARGRNLFEERVAIPKVRKLEHGEGANYEGVNPKLVIELPLTIRRQTILRQVNRLLDEHHTGQKLRVHEFSTAERRLYPNQRIRKSTFPPLMAVWQERKRNKKEEWWETGERLKLSPIHTVAEGDDADTVAWKHRIMALTVQRLHRKAKSLIDFAARGDFPRFK